MVKKNCSVFFFFFCVPIMPGDSANGEECGRIEMEREARWREIIAKKKPTFIWIFVYLCADNTGGFFENARSVGDIDEEGRKVEKKKSRRKKTNVFLDFFCVPITPGDSLRMARSVGGHR